MNNMFIAGAIYGFVGSVLVLFTIANLYGRK
jgi:hypothetical protein